MVQTDISQNAAECADWRQALRSYRDEMGHHKKELEALCRAALSKEQLHQVEHLHNQFHIQLINIHDLKQTIKAHERSLQLSLTPSGQLRAQHEDLYEKFARIEGTLQELRSEFSNFRSQIS